jgi:hypothetical protein
MLGNLPRCPSMDEWIHKMMRHIYTMEYYLVTNKNKLYHLQEND